MGICRGYGCKNTELIEAHIIPRGFARDVMGDHKHVLLISKNSFRPTHHGVWDKNLLCAECDRALGDLDNSALNVCRRFLGEHRVMDGYFVMDNVDGDQFAKFILSVLWRASISTRREFTRVSLGPYEAIAGEVTFGARPLTEIPSYQLIVSRYQVSNRFNPAQNYTMPVRANYGDFKGWAFALHGFSILAKLDKRPFPAEWRPAIVNGNTALTGAFVDYLSTIEGKAIMGMAAAHRARRAR